MKFLLVEETAVTKENHRPVESHLQTSSQPVESHLQTSSCNVVLRTPRLNWIRTHDVSVIGTDCIGSYKSNHHRSQSIPRQPLFSCDLG